jgi:hypothetical protein
MAIHPSQHPPPLPISILPLETKDYPIVASLEAEVFSDDLISVYAFGTLRTSPTELAKRAASLGKPAVGCVVRMRKAVTKEGRIVGFTFWKFLEDGYNKPSGDQDEEVLDENIEEADEVNGAEGADEAEEQEQEQQSRWPEGADVEFCEAVFGKSDELREAVFKGQRHASTLSLPTQSRHRIKIKTHIPSPECSNRTSRISGSWHWLRPDQRWPC